MACGPRSLSLWCRVRHVPKPNKSGEAGYSPASPVSFSSRPRDLAFDNYLYLGHDEQRMFDSFEELCRVTGGEPCATDPGLGDGLAPAT